MSFCYQYASGSLATRLDFRCLRRQKQDKTDLRFLLSLAGHHRSGSVRYQCTLSLSHAGGGNRNATQARQFVDHSHTHTQDTHTPKSTRSIHTYIMQSVPAGTVFSRPGLALRALRPSLLRPLRGTRGPPRRDQKRNASLPQPLPMSPATVSGRTAELLRRGSIQQTWTRILSCIFVTCNLYLFFLSDLGFISVLRSCILYLCTHPAFILAHLLVLLPPPPTIIILPAFPVSTHHLDNLVFPFASLVFIYKAPILLRRQPSHFARLPITRFLTRTSPNLAFLRRL